MYSGFLAVSPAPRSRNHRPFDGVHVASDAEFFRESLMRWREENSVDFVLGLPRNSRLQQAITEELRQVRRACEATGRSARVYCELRYRTRASWSRERRVVGKAEHLAKGANPRFVVTSLKEKAYPAWRLYEQEYCRRGDASSSR
ncbi:MAG: transposase [Planctomycetales bacterium]